MPRRWIAKSHGHVDNCPNETWRLPLVLLVAAPLVLVLVLVLVLGLVLFCQLILSVGWSGRPRLQLFKLTKQTPAANEQSPTLISFTNLRPEQKKKKQQNQQLLLFVRPNNLPRLKTICIRLYGSVSNCSFLHSFRPLQFSLFHDQITAGNSQWPRVISISSRCCPFHYEIHDPFSHSGHSITQTGGFNHLHNCSRHSNRKRSTISAHIEEPPPLKDKKLGIDRGNATNISRWKPRSASSVNNSTDCVDQVVDIDNRPGQSWSGPGHGATT